MTSGARNSGVPKLTRSFSLGLYLSMDMSEIHKYYMFYNAKCANKAEGNTSTYILARPKSIILTLLVILLTHRMFSGWNPAKHNHFTWCQSCYTRINKVSPQILYVWLLLPSSRDAGWTFCACAAGRHRSAWWTARHPAPLKCGFHQWSCQTAHLQQH